MRDSLTRYCNNYRNNKELLKNTFTMESSYMIPIGANILTEKGIHTNQETLKNCKALLKREVGLFSNFRGNGQLALICQLAAASDPEARLARSLELYEILRKEFHRDEYVAMVAGILAEMVPEGSVEYYVTRGRELYSRMKDEHPFLTGREDSVFAVLLAFSDKSDDLLMEEMEKCYSRLKKTLNGDSNATQSLSHVLAMTEGDWLTKCEHVEELYESLKVKGRKFGRYYELPVLGSAAILFTGEQIMGASIQDIVNDTCEVDEFLADQKGYGFFGYDKKTRLMHALMLVVSDYAKAYGKENTSVSALTSTMAMVAAQQAAMVAVMAASAASTSAANT